MSMTAPSIEYAEILPMLIVFGAAVGGVIIEAIVPRGRRFTAQLVLGVGALAMALVAVLTLAGTRHAAMVGAVAVDGPALFIQGVILLIGLPSLLVIAERGNGGLAAFTAQAAEVPGSAGEIAATKVGMTQTEVFPLTLFAVGGLLLFPAANDLLTMFIALEIFSLPLYVLCGLARYRRLLSQEAALKYFLLGAFSSAFFLYGIALLYGYSGTLSLDGISAALAASDGNRTMALVGVGLLSVGALFKIGAVPFHSWIPDVYQGAPTPITAFMAAATKVAAFGAMLRIFYVALPALSADWRPVLSVVAILTMVMGAVLTVAQTDITRLLAYSAVAQAGFILIGLIAANQAGLSSSLFYLCAYGFSTLGAFAVIGLVRGSDGAPATEISQWAGLGRRSPLLGLVFSLFLLAFAGIPLTSGFVSKFAVFKAAAEGGSVALVVFGVIGSAIAAFVYIRMILLMFFAPTPGHAPKIAVPSGLTSSAILAGAAVTVVAGILPQPLLDLVGAAGAFLE